MQGLAHRLRSRLSGREALIIYRIVFGVIALFLVRDALRSHGLIEAFNVDFGTNVWFISALIIASSIIGVLCILLMSRNWAWAVWVWSLAALGTALIGVFIVDLNASFIERWDVALPWVVLALAALLKSRFATPWRIGGTAWVVPGVVLVLAGLGLSVHLTMTTLAEREQALLEPLYENMQATNERLPEMLNEELRLDRMSFENNTPHQHMSFPYHTVADLSADPGLDQLHDFYAEAFMAALCDMPGTSVCLASGSDCGRIRYEFSDMNGEAVTSFTLRTAECRLR